MIAAATGAIQLVRMLRDDGPPVAAKITPTADFEPDVRWRAYQAQHPELQPGTGAVDAQYGVVFTVSVKLDGLEGEKVALRWRPLDPSGVGAADPALGRTRALAAPDEDSDWRVTRRVWAPQPPAVAATGWSSTSRTRKARQGRGRWGRW